MQQSPSRWCGKPAIHVWSQTLARALRRDSQSGGNGEGASSKVGTTEEPRTQSSHTHTLSRNAVGGVINTTDPVIHVPIFFLDERSWCWWLVGLGDTVGPLEMTLRACVVAHHVCGTLLDLKALLLLYKRE